MKHKKPTKKLNERYKDLITTLTEQEQNRKAQLKNFPYWNIVRKSKIGWEIIIWKLHLWINWY